MKRKFRKDKEKEQEPQAEAPQEQPEGEAPQEPTAEEQPAQEAQETDGITDLKPLLEASRQKAEEYLNLAQRVQADFENFRRRNKATRAEAFEEGAREFIKQLLPVVERLYKPVEHGEPDMQYFEFAAQGSAEEFEEACEITKEEYEEKITRGNPAEIRGITLIKEFAGF